MTAMDAVRISQGFTRLSLWNYFGFLGLSLGFSGLTVLSPEIHETLAYADMRKVMIIGYTLPAVTLLLIALYLTGRSNAALRFAEAKMLSDPESEQIKFRWNIQTTQCVMAVVFHDGAHHHGELYRVDLCGGWRDFLGARALRLHPSRTPLRLPE